MLNPTASLRYYRDQTGCTGNAGVQWLRVVIVRAMRARGIQVAGIRRRAGHWQVSLDGDLWINTTDALNMQILEE